VAVDGVKVKVDAFLTSTVCAGEKGYFYIVLSKTDMEGNLVGKAREASFTLHGYSTSKKLFGIRLDTDPITVYGESVSYQGEA
jgi:hypothetical protein